MSPDLVTATPVELASILSRRLGLTGALGTVAETKDGVYTGLLVGGLLHGPAKSAGVEALARREGLDLARCAAYSDSVNDLPMLLLVNPVLLGKGKRLFADGTPPRAFAFVGSKVSPTGILANSYKAAGTLQNLK